MNWITEELEKILKHCPTEEPGREEGFNTGDIEDSAWDCAYWSVAQVLRPLADRLRDRRVVEVFKDGDAWCALEGANLQEGVSGFDKSPCLALVKVCQEWNEAELSEESHE